MTDESNPYTPDAYTRFESGFLDSEFSYPASEIEQQFFDNVSQPGDGTSSVVYESNVDRSLVSELESEQSTFGNVFELNGKRYVLKIRIFVSRDDSYLSRVYESTTPKPDEICLFLEDNSTDLFSPRSYYVKIGDIFSRYLESRQDDLALNEAMEHATELSRDGGQGVTASFSRDEILTLIKDGSLSGNSIITPFLSVFKAVHSWSAWINDGIGSGILKGTESVKYYLKFADTSWDPEAERKDKSNFHPVLIPSLVVTTQEEVLSVFTSALQAHARFVIDKLDTLATQNLPPLPSTFGDFLTRFQKMVAKLKEVAKSFSDAIIRDLTAMMDYFQGLGQHMLYVINAYYCGLWNSLVDALMAIPDILGYMFKLSALPGKIAKNIDTLAPKVMELMDEILQIAFTTDWPKLIKTIITETGKGLIGLLSSSTGYLSWERVAYFIGAVTGFIIENIIGFLLSAGAVNIVSITAKLGKFGKFVDVIVGIVSGVNQTVNAASEAVLMSIIKVVGSLLSILRKGAAEAKVLIRTLFSKINKATKVADDVIEALFEQLGMTVEHLRRLRAAGFEITDVADDGLSGVIKKTCK